MNSLKDKIEELSSAIGRIEGDVDACQRMQAATPYIENVCMSINQFISSEVPKLKETPPEEQLSLVVTMINSISTYCNNYAKKHVQDLYIAQGKILARQEVSNAINKSLEEYANQQKTKERIKEKLESGIDEEKRKVSERPERISDVRNVKKEIAQQEDI